MLAHLLSSRPRGRDCSRSPGLCSRRRDPPASLGKPPRTGRRSAAGLEGRPRTRSRETQQHRFRLRAGRAPWSEGELVGPGLARPRRNTGASAIPRTRWLQPTNRNVGAIGGRRARFALHRENPIRSARAGQRRRIRLAPCEGFASNVEAYSSRRAPNPGRLRFRPSFACGRGLDANRGARTRRNQFERAANP